MAHRPHEAKPNVRMDYYVPRQLGSAEPWRFASRDKVSKWWIGQDSNLRSPEGTGGLQPPAIAAMRPIHKMEDCVGFEPTIPVLQTGDLPLVEQSINLGRALYSELSTPKRLAGSHRPSSRSAGQSRT